MVCRAGAVRAAARARASRTSRPTTSLFHRRRRSGARAPCRPRPAQARVGRLVRAGGGEPGHTPWRAPRRRRAAQLRALNVRGARRPRRAAGARAGRRGRGAAHQHASVTETAPAAAGATPLRPPTALACVRGWARACTAARWGLSAAHRINHCPPPPRHKMDPARCHALPPSPSSRARSLGRVWLGPGRRHCAALLGWAALLGPLGARLHPACRGAGAPSTWLPPRRRGRRGDAGANAAAPHAALAAADSNRRGAARRRRRHGGARLRRRGGAALPRRRLGGPQRCRSPRRRARAHAALAPGGPPDRCLT
jgi:hypothetical protein